MDTGGDGSRKLPGTWTNVTLDVEKHKDSQALCQAGSEQFKNTLGDFCLGCESKLIVHCTKQCDMGSDFKY